MSGIAIKREQTGTRQGNAAQELAVRTAKAMNGMSFPLSAVWVKGVVFASGAGVTVVHGLGTVPVGYLVANQRNFVSGIATQVRVVSAGDPPETQSIVLNGQGIFTADVLVW